MDTDPAVLTYASRMAAKVDSAGLQDGYQIYHHTFVFNREGKDCVVQQGMNASTRYLRRYHYPVDRANYDQSIATLEQALRRVRVGDG